MLEHRAKWTHFGISLHNSPDEKSYFRACAAMIKERAPALYEDLWAKKFAASAPRKASVPPLKEAIDACSAQSHHSWNRNDFKTWEKD